MIYTNIFAQASGQYLTYNDVDGKWRNTYLGSIDTLSDVVITAPIAANSYLTYNTFNWVNKTFPISVDESGNISMLGTLNITGVNLLNTKDVDTWITEHEANNDKVSADGSIDTHSDVLITGTPADNQLLIYSTGQWRNVASPFLRLDGTANMTGALNMNSQNITNVGSLNGRVVSTLFTEHDANKAKVSADGSIDTHSDVIISTAADNQLLIYSTGQWRNVASPFLRLDGTANMTGGLNMNSQNITNVGSLNGRVVSTLFTEHDANKAKISADGSIDAHSDVIISTAADNQLLIYSTGQWRNQNSPFLRLDGTANMTGGLNMNSQNITNVGSLNGRVVSTLFTEHDANKAKVSADGSIDTHSDVIISTAADNNCLSIQQVHGETRTLHF